MFIELRRSRLLLFAAWLLPLLLYFGLSISLPHIHEGRVSSVQVFGILFSLGQVFVPVVMVFLAFYFPGSQPNEQLTILTKERFWVTLIAIAFYHLVMLSVFISHVVFADYTGPDTYQETVEGRIDLFAKLALYFSIPLIYPIRALFQRS